MASPTVSSISPASGPTAGSATVTITGTNFTGTTGVTIGGSAAAGVIVVSSTSITCTTPSGAVGTASVLVTNASGTNAANSLYTYVAAPTVTGISPASGPTGGGSSVTITGTNFSGATSVTIGGAAATITGVSGTSITCTIPGGSAGTASVLVTTPGGTNAANSLYTYVAAPTVSGVTASKGPLGGGTSVTIAGTGFTYATGVSFGGKAATVIVINSDTSLSCTTPSGSVGVVSVVVTNPGGSNAANSLYEYVAAPTVTGISPTNGTANGGTSVTITGTNFSYATGVTIGGAAATITGVSGTSITCTTPSSGSGGGAASVLVTTPGGTNAANSLYTYVLTPPTVTAVSPASATAAGGITLTITGTNFSAVSGVTLRGVAATGVTVVSSTIITCTTPAMTTPGAAGVLVTTPSGTNAANSLFAFVPPQPTVTGTSGNGTSPASGSTLGGTTVTVTGTNLSTAGGVTIGGVAATNVTVLSDTSLTCITPAGSVGTVSVVVTTAGGTNADNDLFSYELLAPSVSSISPGQGTAAGGTAVTISGANFTGTTGVTIDGVAADRVIVLNDSTIICLTPAGSAGTAKSVVVSSPSGQNADNSLFTYVLALPTVSGVSPPIGAATGATSVLLTGTHFTGATSVTFGGVPATGITVVDDTTLTCTTPAGLAGTASVLVTAAAGTSAENSLYLYVQAVPTDTYIYLKGARGDGFVPLWTGALSEEGMVGDTGSPLGTAGREVSDPYRDIHNYSTTIKTAMQVPSGYVINTGELDLSGTTFKINSAIPTPTTGLTQGGFPVAGFISSYTPYGVGPVPTAGAASLMVSGLTPQVSDEVAHEKPRQFARISTWLIFTSQSGLSYKFRKDQILGWGSQPRS